MEIRWELVYRIDGVFQVTVLLSCFLFIGILKVEQVDHKKWGKRRTRELFVYLNFSDRDPSEQPTGMMFSDLGEASGATLMEVP